MIRKCTVLFRIKHFQKGRCRIPAEITAYLVYLVEKEERIVGACFDNIIDDASRNSSDICTSVSSYLGFISYAAEGHPDKFPACSSCY